MGPNDDEYLSSDGAQYDSSTEQPMYFVLDGEKDSDESSGSTVTHEVVSARDQSLSLLTIPLSLNSRRPSIKSLQAEDNHSGTNTPTSAFSVSPIASSPKLERLYIGEKKYTDTLSTPSSSGTYGAIDFASGDFTSSDEDKGMIILDGDFEGMERQSRGSAAAFWTVFALVDFLAAAIVSLQAPFYPGAAEDKGATPWQYGLVFGVFELAVFLFTPILGPRLNAIGPWFLFNTGIFTTGVCSVLFGLLQLVDDTGQFIGYSVAIRALEALGDTALVTSSYVIMASRYPLSVSSNLASLESFYGLGLLCGPLIGACFYQIGGFFLPFVVVGAALLFCGFVTSTFISSSLSDPQESSENKPILHGLKIFELLRLPRITLRGLFIVIAAMGTAFFNLTLQPILQQFELGPLYIGLFFMISGGGYVISAPILGLIFENRSSTVGNAVAAIGSFLILSCFTLIGPLWFTRLERSLWLMGLSLGLHGIGLGALLVLSLKMILREACHQGYEDDTSTYGLVTGFWTAMFAFGSFLGSIVSGFLFDWFGFEKTVGFFVGLQIIVTVVLAVWTIIEWLGGSSQNLRRCDSEFRELNEASPLLP